MITKEEFVKNMRDRMYWSLNGTVLYPKENSNIITSEEINALESVGYVFVSVGVSTSGKVRALFKNLKD